MIDISKVVEPSYEQWEAIIRGMRNPMNSWDKSDSNVCCYYEGPETEHCSDCPRAKGCTGSDVDVETRYILGPADHDLMMKLRNNGSSSHRKFMRMIPVYLDINAPLYWWKEFDTYKVGTVANSCSTMHKIATKKFELSDFSHEHLTCNGGAVRFEEGKTIDDEPTWQLTYDATGCLLKTIDNLNYFRDHFNRHPECKLYWWQMIQLLPSSYNQKRTVFLNYEVLANIYHDRKDHKLDEWRKFCEWIESLSYSELITGDKK